MSQKIDLDHGRFRQIIRGKIKQNLRKYISQGEMIAKKGKDTVSIPVPSVDIPHFKHGDKQQGGVGQGDGDVGDSLGQGCCGDERADQVGAVFHDGLHGIGEQPPQAEHLFLGDVTGQPAGLQITGQHTEQITEG